MAIENLSLVGGGPEDVRKKLAAMMLQQGMSGEPVGHWTQGVNRVAQAMLGGMDLRNLDEQDQADWSKLRTAITAASGGGTGGGQPPMPPPAAAEPPPMQRPPAPSPSPPAGAMPVDPPYDAPVTPGMRSRGVSTEGSIYGGLPGWRTGERPMDSPRPPSPLPAAPMPGGDDPMAFEAAKQRIRDGQGTRYEMPQEPAAQPTSPSISTGGATPLQQVAQAQAPPAPQVAREPGAGLPREGQPPQAAPPQAAPDKRQAMIDLLLNSKNKRWRDLGLQMSLKEPESQWDKLNEETLYNKRTAATRSVTEGFRPITDAAERTRFGIPPDDKRPYQISPAGKLINPPAETRLTVDQRGETKFREGAARVQTERFGKLIEVGHEAQGIVADVSTLKDIGARITTGKTTEIAAAIGPYAEMLGVKIDNLEDMQAFKAVVAKMAPRMRVAGSGATSDFEMRQFLESLPTLGKTPGGNEIISNTLEAMAEHRMAAADIASKALAEELTPREAEKQLRELPNPLEVWKKSRPGQSPTAAGGGGGVRRYNPATGKIE